MNQQQIDSIQNFYERHQHELYIYALSILGAADHAEDAVHNAFARILRKRKTPKELRPYVFRCVRNAAIDELRFASRRNGTAILFDTADPAIHPKSSMTAMEIEELLLALSQDERETIILKIYGGMTFKEIASTRRTSQNTAASWYRRGLAKLRATLEEEDSP